MIKRYASKTCVDLIYTGFFMRTVPVRCESKRNKPKHPF